MKLDGEVSRRAGGLLANVDFRFGYMYLSGSRKEHGLYITTDDPALLGWNCGVGDCGVAVLSRWMRDDVRCERGGMRVLGT